MLSALIVRSSDPTALLVWCGVGFCAGIGLFIYGFKLLQRRRLILDTPFSKIRSAAMGMVEVSGLAVGPYTMIAPITARPCYYYRTLVWEYKQRGKNKEWVKVAGECMHVPFFVDDNTGRMLVDPRGADLDLHCDFEEQFCDSFFTVKDSAPDNVRNFLGRHGIVTNNKIKVQEYCIKPKNSLFILGTLSENLGVEVSPQAVRDDDSISSGGMSFSIGSISVNSVFSSSARGGDDSGIASEVTWSATHTEDSPQKLIRLTAEGAAKSTAEMSQQQKVAAALLKAGISSPAAWAAAGVSAAGPGHAVVQTIADPASPGGTAQSNAFDPHPAGGADEGEQQQDFSDLVAQPAGGGALAGLEMRADDLGRPGARFVVPILLPGYWAFALNRAAAHHISNLTGFDCG